MRYEELQTKAGITAMEAKADAASCDKILLGMRAELNHKATADELEKESDRLSALSEVGICEICFIVDFHPQTCVELQQHVGVAVRFVEWFSERG